MINIYQHRILNPTQERQLRCRDNLFSLYNCPIKTRQIDIWSNYSYIVYVVEGRKIWHTAHGSYDLTKGSCVFVRKGAHITEQFFDATFCMVLFFISDEFICDVLKSKTTPIYKANQKYQPVITINSTATLKAFYQSMLHHFDAMPDQSLVELKFRELILTIAGDTENGELLSYFGSLLQDPQAVSLQSVMEDNYCFNLKLPGYAQLCNRSLSAFKRDFQKQFNTTPGKWLIEKRLQHGMHLLSNVGKTVSEAAFESGFENPAHFSRSFREYFGTNPAAIKQPIAI